MTVYDFQIEYQDAPRGLGARVPRFSWKQKSEERATVQTAYRLCVESAAGTLWDTGRMESAASVLIPYGGTALTEETEYRAALTVWDNHGNEAQSETCFSTGLFDGVSLAAKMITHDFPAEETACPVFYTHFHVKKPVARACLYATAHGVYEASVNGSRIGDVYLAPGWTEYHHRLQFQYYDVENIAEGENLLEITVGNGWYKGILSYDTKPNRYGDRVEVLAELHIFYSDGTKEVIATDDGWKVRTGMIRYSEIYNGETQDTNAPEILDGTVSEVPFDKTLLVPQMSEPVRITERIPAKRVFTDPKGNTLIDFGQNLTGVVEVTIRGHKGQRIELRHAEVLDKEAETWIESPYGRISCRWSCRKKKIRVEITVPCNTTAEITLPEKNETIETGSGTYIWEYDTETDLRALCYSFDSRIGELMATGKGLALMNRHLAVLVNSPMIDYIKNMTVAEGIHSAAELRPAFQAVIDALNEEDENV